MSCYHLKQVPDGWVVTDEYGNCVISEVEKTKEHAFAEMIRMIADDNKMYVHLPLENICVYDP